MIETPGNRLLAASEPAPEEALQPFRPDTDGPWDRAAAAHLARRIAFGMPAETVERILALGPQQAPAELLRECEESDDVNFATGVAMQVASLDSAQSAWVYRMLRSRSPAREKLALFWHGHFATSQSKVENVGLMQDQIELFRKLGSGPFPGLVAAIARDPAMLLWLDGNSNRRGKPNENFARELMELFALGIGNYTEDDIKEAARAFTGWHVKNEEYWFNARAHDEGEKSVFGQRGNFNGDDIVKLCVSMPAASELIAGKLFEYYVRMRPQPELRRELGKAYASVGQNTGEFLQRLFASRVFHAASSRRALVSTPADFAVGSLRTLGATASASAVAKALRAMGQELLAPPTVKGWDMGQSWLSSPTLLARYRFAAAAARVGGDSVEKSLGSECDWNALAAPPGVISRFFPEGLPGPVVEAVEASAGGEVKSLAANCMQIPEYQFI